MLSENENKIEKVVFLVVLYFIVRYTLRYFVTQKGQKSRGKRERERVTFEDASESTAKQNLVINRISSNFAYFMNQTGWFF